MDNRDKQIKDVEDILSNSDIVWTKYGSESKFELATQIVDTLNNNEKESVFHR